VNVFGLFVDQILTQSAAFLSDVALRPGFFLRDDELRARLNEQAETMRPDPEQVSFPLRYQCSVVTDAGSSVNSSA
jgi:hypothetical protein